VAGGVAAGDLRKGDANLIVIDAATMSIEARLPLCLAAHGVRITPDGSMLALSGDERTAWGVCEGDHVGPGSLVTVDLVAGAPTGSTPLGVFPDGLVMVP